MDKEMKTMIPVTMKRHVLPGEEGGNTAWFYRQNSFEQQDCQPGSYQGHYRFGIE